MANILENMRVTEVSLVKRGADQDAHVKMTKAADDEPAPEEGQTMPTELNAELAKALGEEAVTALSEEAIVAMNAVADATTEKQPDPDSNTPTPKTVPATEPTKTPATGDELTKTSPEMVALRKELDESNARVEAIETERGLEKARAEAREQFGSVATNVDEIGEAMYFLEKGAPREGDAAVLRKALETASATITTAPLTQEIGSSASGVAGAPSVLTAKATELMQKSLGADDGRGLSPSQALLKTLDTHDPEVMEEYAQHVRDQRARSRAGVVV